MAFAMKLPTREELSAYIEQAPKPIDVHDPDGEYGNGLYLYDDRGVFCVLRPERPTIQRLRSGRMVPARSNSRWRRRHSREF